jgi:hypothetical protein
MICFIAVQSFRRTAEGKRLFRRYRSGREDNIKMHLKELRLEGVGSINLAQARNYTENFSTISA